MNIKIIILEVYDPRTLVNERSSSVRCLFRALVVFKVYVDSGNLINFKLRDLIVK